MRVLHVIPAVAPRYGGPSAAVLGMCRALAERGHSVMIAATDADGAGHLAVPSGRATAYRGVPSIFFRAHLGEALKASPGLRAWLARSVGGFDLVHVHAVFSHSSLAAGRACRRQGVPYIVRPLGTLDPQALGRKAWRKRAFLSAVGRRLISGAAALHFTTNAERDLAWRTMAPHAAFVVPLGIPDRVFDAPEAAAREPLVAAISRFDRGKNLVPLALGFLEAVARAGASGWRLVIAGDGDPAVGAELSRLAAANPDRLILRGWIGEDERRSLLRRARLFALPSAHENFGLSVLEAMAEGLPVLVAPGVNLSPAIDRAGAGWVVEPTSDAIARCLGAIMGGEDLAVPAARARELSQSYRWSVVAQALESAYERLITARRLRPEPVTA